MNVVWSEVTGLCGFWDGSCENGTCGAGIMIQALTKIPGGTPIHTKCGGCGVGMPWMPNWAAAVENLSQWVDKSLCVQ